MNKGCAPKPPKNTQARAYVWRSRDTSEGEFAHKHQSYQPLATSLPIGEMSETTNQSLVCCAFG